MKKVHKISLILVLILLAVSLFSCKKDDSDIVFRYGEVEMSERMFFYELCSMKTEHLSENGITGKDVPELWSTVIAADTTYDKLIYAQCQANISSLVFFANYAKTHAGDLTDDEIKALRESADEVVAQMGSKKAFNNYLKTYGIDYDIFCEHLELWALYYKGVNLAYGEGGEFAFTEDEIMDYFKNNYVTVKHVAIGTELAGQDKDGNPIYYTEEEKAERQKKIEEIRTSLAAGEDFDKFYLESEDGQGTKYPDGYTITAGAMNAEMKGYESAAFELDVGEVTEWEKEGFAHYFIKRVDLLESDVENVESYIVSSLMQKDMLETVFEHYDEFYMNQDIINTYNMASVPVMK
mgnify:CR=1 FL=1